jgi:hypothetical protein
MKKRTAVVPVECGMTAPERAVDIQSAVLEIARAIAAHEQRRNIVAPPAEAAIAKRRPQFPVPRTVVRAPGQRRLDHGARSRLAEWRAYRAAWQGPINALECSAEAFYHLRRDVLTLNRKQTARLLRASVNSVLNWEHGVHPVPFYAYLALLLISEAVQYRFANTAWKDWDLAQYYDADPRLPKQKRGYVSKLVNRELDIALTPQDLEKYAARMWHANNLEAHNATLRAEVEELTREIAALREQAGTDAIAGDLQDVRAGLKSLLERIPAKDAGASSSESGASKRDREPVKACPIPT